MAWKRRSLAGVWRDIEARLFLVAMVVSVLGIAAFLAASGVYPTFGEALRHAAFNVVSIATTTGFAIGRLRAVADLRAGR